MMLKGAEFDALPAIGGPGLRRDDGANNDDGANC